MVYTVLSRERLLAADDTLTETVDVPEWGGSVVLRSLTLAQAKKVRRYIADNRDNAEVDDLDIAMVVLIEGMVDPQLDAGDVVALSGKQTSVITRLSRKVIDLSRMGNLLAEVERAKNV